MEIKKLLIFGACSAIARETAKLFAKEGTDLFLVDLNLSRLEDVKADINTLFPTKIHLKEMNANDFENHDSLFIEASTSMNGLDAILIAHGTLANQLETQQKIDLILQEFNTNCTSVISLASAAANYFEQKKKGCIAVISSVAGDRGRQSNYIYGAAKGGVTIFLQGLRNRLSKSGIQVITIKPGQVDTPMTAHMPKTPLFAKPQVIGKGIFDAMVKGKDVVYLPGFWRIIMSVVKLIPEKIFKKLNL